MKRFHFLFITILISTLSNSLPVNSAPKGRKIIPQRSEDWLNSHGSQLHFELIGRSSTSKTVLTRRMLDLGLPVDTEFDNADRDTILTHAAAFGNLDVVHLLLKRGANPNSQNINGQTALWQAASAPMSESGTYTMNGSLPATNAESLAWRNAYVGIIKELIAHGAKLNLGDEIGTTPLIVATYRGRETQVKALLDGGADPNRRDRFGKTPIQWAAYRGFPSIVKLLRAHGAWIAAPGLRDQNGRDLDERLVDAISRHNLGAVKRLLAQGADPNARVDELTKYSPNDAYAGQFTEIGLDTPLMASANSPYITRLLLQHGANPHAIDRYGETVLSIASADVSRMLLQRGVKVNARGFYGHTPIMSADDPAKVVLLLAHGANADARDTSGANAILSCSNEVVLRLLVKNGADINAKGGNGRTALISASDSLFGEGDMPACNAYWARVLLRNGANPNVRDSNGNTALMLLAKQGDYGPYNNGDQLGLVRSLLEYGARRDLRNHFGHNAVQLAKSSGAKRVSRLLLAWRPRTLHVKRRR